MDIGAAVEEHMKPGAKIIWFDLAPHMYWNIEHNGGVRFGETREGTYAWTKDSPTTYPAILDSGTSLVMVPSQIYSFFMAKLIENSAQRVSYKLYNGKYMTTCQRDLFPSIYFLLEHHWVEMSPKDYILKASTDPTETDTCFIGITSLDADMFVLGDSFMRGFYTIHSDSHAMVGIVPHSNSSKSSPKFDHMLPTRFLDATHFFNLTLLEIEKLVSGIFSSFMLCYIVYYCLVSYFSGEDEDGRKIEDSNATTSDLNVTKIIL